MKQSQIFGNAVWVGGDDFERDKFFILRRRFNVDGVKRATLRVLGLGFFHCYINGIEVSQDKYLPLHTHYEARDAFPYGEVLTAHRVYVPEYDITAMLCNGENYIAIHFGGGWYTYEGEAEKRFGDAKAIWRIFGEDSNGDFDFVSSTNDKISPSFITDYLLINHETQDYSRIGEDALSSKFDDSSWSHASTAKQLDTDYEYSDCPTDRVCEILAVHRVRGDDDHVVYDCSKNISGYPVLKLLGKCGAKVRVVFSEEIGDNGELDLTYSHNQIFEIVCDGKEKAVCPLFTWFAFRYFAIWGDAEVESVEVVHSNVKLVSSFESDNLLLNWIHDTFLNTQLMNMHNGIPSDCPHLERRGYTGDGQLICHAAMNMLDGKQFYRKWIRDILDCQDTLSGHVQYTAPYTHAGGGPGGWGGAIVEVPYQYHRHYGDIELLRECYPQMIRYFDFLESHSYGDLVVSDKEGEWCLGDWCPPTAVILPAPFVNNYFYIKWMMRCVEIAQLIGCESDIAMLEKRIKTRKEALMKTYYNMWDGNFFGGVQGANAFAVDIGIGDWRTYGNLVDYYKKLGHYDTGIFGTDVVTRVLFEHGDGQLATDLMLADDIHSFAAMRREGATTLREYWPCSLCDRSHNHPMFGAIVAYFYDYLLGIRAKEGSVAYCDVEVSPVLVNGVDQMSGYRVLPSGKLSVAYAKADGHVSFKITVPSGQRAEFVYADKRYALAEGENNFNL